MAISFISRATSGGGLTFTPTVTAPSSVQIGDLMMVYIMRSQAGVMDSGATSGWTVLEGGESSSSQTHCLYKFATVAGAQTLSFPFLFSKDSTIFVNVFRGVSTVSTINTSATSSGHSVNVLSFPRPTTTVDGCMIVRQIGGFVNSSGWTISISAGQLGGGSAAPDSTVGALSSYELQTTAGQIGSGSASFNAPITDVYESVYCLKPDQPPSAPSGISLNPTSPDTSATVSFTHGTDPEGSSVVTEVEFSTDNGANWSAMATSTANASSVALDFSGVSAGTQTKLRLRSLAGGLYSSYTTTSAFTVAHAPSAPTILTPTAGITRTIGVPYTISWNASTDPDTAQSSITYRVEISTNNQSTWSLVNTTAAGVTSLSYDFSGKPANSVTFIQVRGNDGTNDGAWSTIGPFTLATDVAPGAPTSLSPSSGAFDVAQALTVTWVFNDPGDVQSGYTIEWGTNGSTFPNTTSQNTAVASHTYSGSTFSAGPVYIRVKTKDNAGTYGSYSQVALTGSTKPSTPTITSPTNGGSTGSATPTVTWTSSGQASYELIITNSSDVQLWTSGLIVSAATSKLIGISLQNSGSYKAKLYIKNSDGLASNTATNSFTVAFTGPSTPTLTVTPEEFYGYNLVNITNPASSPATTYNQVWRFVTAQGSSTAIMLANQVGLNTLAFWRDRTAAAQTEYSYYVRAFASNGEFTQSTNVTATLTLQNLCLHAVDDPESMVQLVNLAQNDSRLHAGKTVEVDGSTDPIAIFMPRTQRALSYTCVISRFDSTTRQRLEAMYLRRKTICVRDQSGNKAFAVLFQLPAQYSSGSIEYSLSFQRVRYVEGLNTTIVTDQDLVLGDPNTGSVLEA